MVEWMIHNSYQEVLAERSMHTEPVGLGGPGEYWEFKWYIDPLSNGLGKWIQLTAHVCEDLGVRMIGMPVALDEEEMLAQEQAVRFVKDRYERYGLDEYNQESGN